MIKEGVVLVFLGISTWTDLRKRQVSLIITGLFAAAGLGWMLYQGALSAELLLSVGPGMFFLGLSVLTGGTLGMGDGWIITALGIFLKPEELYEMLLAAVLISAAWSGILMGIFKKKEIQRSLLCHFCWPWICRRFIFMEIKSIRRQILQN